MNMRQGDLRSTEYKGNIQSPKSSIKMDMTIRNYKNTVHDQNSIAKDTKIK